MIKIIAADDKKETEIKDNKEPKEGSKQDKKPVKKSGGEDKKKEPKEKVEEKKLTPKDYFKENTNFKFEAYINDTPIKETTIREPGKYGLVRFIREVFLAIKNRRAPVVVAKMNGNNLSVNPIAPVEKTTVANITPRGYALGVIAEFRKLGLKCNEFVSLYDYSKGKLNTTVSKILNKHIKVSNGEIAEIEDIKKLSDVIPRLNSDKRLQDEMKKILTNYNNYVTMYSRYLLNIAQTKFKG